VQGEEQSLWGGWDGKGLGEGLGAFSPYLLFPLNLPTSLVLLPAISELFAYSAGSGEQNRGRTGYHEKKGGGQGSVAEGLEWISLGHKAPAKRSLWGGPFSGREEEEMRRGQLC